jgi:hypothetical protein
MPPKKKLILGETTVPLHVESVNSSSDTGHSYHRGCPNSHCDGFQGRRFCFFCRRVGCFHHGTRGFYSRPMDGARKLGKWWEKLLYTRIQSI